MTAQATQTARPPAGKQPPAAPKTQPGAAVTIIRLRGTQNLNPKTKDTLRYLRLNRINHAVVLPQNDTTRGMLQVAKDYVTWGEVDAGTLAAVIRSRGRVEGNQPLTEAHVAKSTPYKTIDALAAAIAAGTFRYQDIPNVKPLFRLHPARKGLEGIKRSIQAGGALGYRGPAINELLGRMIGGAETPSGAGTAASRQSPVAKASAPAKGGA